MAQRETAKQRSTREQREFQELMDGMTLRSRLEVVDEETGDVAYTLQFCRATVKRMDRDGFKIAALESDDLIEQTDALTKLVCGSFEMHHPSMSEDERLDAWESKVPDKGRCVQYLTALYLVPIQALSKNPTDAGTKLRLV